MSSLMKVARPWCLHLMWPASLNLGSFRMTSFSLSASWSRITFALFLLPICSKTLSLAMVSPMTLSSWIVRLSTEESAR